MPITSFHTRILDFFKGKTVVIAGASSGVGKEIAVLLAKVDCTLLLISRNTDELQKLATSESIANIHVYTCDLTDSNAIQIQLAGLKKLTPPDVLLYSVGVSMFEEIEHTDHSVFVRSMESNFYSFVHLYKFFLTGLKKQKSRLCVIASIQSIIGAQFHGAYTSSKHALSGFLKVIELETPEISIIEILPGWIKGTNIRKNAIDGQGNSLTLRSNHEHQDKSAVELSVARDKILMGIVKETRRIFLPHFWRFIPFLQFAAPNYLKSLISKRNKKESKA